MSGCVSLIVVGAGLRGMHYAQFARVHPDKLKITGIAEPLDWNRTTFAHQHGIDKSMQFKSWEELLKFEKLADGAIITTQDNMHVEVAVELARKGYNLLLEKPMAPTLEGCQKIIDAVEKHNVTLSVCHGMRYTAHTQTIKSVIDSGAIGELISIEHMEPVGYDHYAHSYVRGNWRNEQESSFMLLAKSCHDIDWIHYLMGKKCTAVSSFGSLLHFKSENQPEGASDRCLECQVESNCPYSARKIYIGDYKDHEIVNKSGFARAVHPQPSRENLFKALQNSPYGRCVYQCDNDVVDHQIVNLTFEGGQTASFNMIAFTERTTRKSHIFGTRGRLECSDCKIKLFDFQTDTVTEVDIPEPDHALLDFAGLSLNVKNLDEIDIQGQHIDADYNLVKTFVDALIHDDSSMIPSGPQETLQSHKIVFEAERARKENKVISLSF